MAVRSAAPSRLDGAAQADAAMAHGAERMTPDGCGSWHRHFFTRRAQHGV